MEFLPSAKYFNSNSWFLQYVLPFLPSRKHVQQQLRKKLNEKYIAETIQYEYLLDDLTDDFWAIKTVV